MAVYNKWLNEATEFANFLVSIQCGGTVIVNLWDLNPRSSTHGPQLLLENS